MFPFKLLNEKNWSLSRHITATLQIVDAKNEALLNLSAAYIAFVAHVWDWKRDSQKESVFVRVEERKRCTCYK